MIENMEKERMELIKKMNSMGVSHVRGKNHFTMSIEELRELVKVIEKIHVKNN